MNCVFTLTILVEISRAGQNHLTRNSKRQFPNRRKIEPNLRLKKPFWLSSVNYYILTFGITIASFFITWGVLHASEEEMPWITAGIVAGLSLIIAVILRELVFKRAYLKNLAIQQRLDRNIKSVYKSNQSISSSRLTLERNSLLINEIESRSKTVKSIGKLPALHLEVFEMCQEYLRKSGRELEGIYKESPRYEALRRGQKKIQQLHYFHLLSWASLESQQYVQTAKVQVVLNDKIENAQRAISVIETAIQFYPQDENLHESNKAVKEFIVSIKVSHWIEQAERSAFKGNYQRAVSHYRDALFFLERENEISNDNKLLAEDINYKIEELRKKIDN